MFRRSAYENTGPFDPEFSGVEDYDMWLRMAQYGKIANLPELLYLHREHPDSISSRNRYQLAGKVRKLWAKNGVRVAPGHFPPAYPRLLSYVVPTWNRPELLRRALKSLAVQTDRRFEVVVVNDGGQDVASIVHGCLKSLPHCSIETESNSGLAAARNHALQHCSSPLVCFLDDDDRVEPIHAELMIDAMANCSHGLVFGGFRYVRLRHTPLGLFSEQEGPEVHKGWNLEKMWVANYIPVGTYVVRKRLLDRLAPVFDPSLPVLEDWDMLLRLSAQATFGCIPYCVAEITESVDNRGGSRAPAVYRHDPQMLTRYDEVQAREALWKKYMESIYARYASPPDLNPNQLARKRHEYLGGAA
jgi:glycosyltransferase involved in cell wall biosynthesis